MGYNVRFTKSATHDIDDIAKNIAQLWSEKVKTNFLVAISEKLLILEKNPFIYRKSISKPNLRECVVNKNVIMYYAIDEIEHKIIILALKNTKQSF